MSSASFEQQQRPQKRDFPRERSPELPKSYRNVLEKSSSPEAFKKDHDSPSVEKRHKHRHHGHKRHKKEREHSSRRDEFEKKVHNNAGGLNLHNDDLPKRSTLGSAVLAGVTTVKGRRRSVELSDDAGVGNHLRSRVVIIKSRNGDVKPKFGEKKRSFSPQDFSDHDRDFDRHKRPRKTSSAEISDRYSPYGNSSSRLSSERNFDGAKRGANVGGGHVSSTRSRSPNMDDGKFAYKDQGASGGAEWRVKVKDSNFDAGFVPGLFKSISRQSHRPVRNAVQGGSKKEIDKKSCNSRDDARSAAHDVKRSRGASVADKDADKKPKGSHSGDKRPSSSGRREIVKPIVAPHKRQDEPPPVYRDYFQDKPPTVAPAATPGDNRSNNIPPFYRQEIKPKAGTVASVNKIVNNRKDDVLKIDPIVTTEESITKTEKVQQKSDQNDSDDVEEGEVSD